MKPRDLRDFDERPSAYEPIRLEAEDFDHALLESNLRKTPWERIRAHDRALATARLLRRAMEQRDANA